MKQTFAAALASLAIAASGSGLAAQTTDAEKLLASAPALRCTFTASVSTTWKNGVPVPALRSTGRLIINIQNINPASGSALLIRTPINKDLTLMTDEKTRYFFDAGGGKVTLTMVFGEFSSGMKLKAAHSIHDYTALNLGSFQAQPEIVQHWGDCEVVAEQ